jgi:hypothetical protein
MAFLMVITVCLLGYAALEYHIRQALRAHQTTLPDQERQGPAGLAILCRDSSAAHAWAMAMRAQSHRDERTASLTARAIL